MTFEYKIISGQRLYVSIDTDSGERFNIALLFDWSNMYGYYKFTATGAAENYAGVSVISLGDGYFHVEFDMATLTKVNGAPNSAITFLAFHSAWTDAAGHIYNVQFS